MGDIASQFPIAGQVLSVAAQTANQINAARSFVVDPRANAENAQRRQQELALQQLRAQQSLQEAQQQEDASLRQKELTLQAETSENARQAALRRAVSRQNARFGASGIAGSGGSSEAVLLGLFEESEDEKQRREQLDNIRSSAISQDLSQGSSLNVLQRTQLQQRQDLERLLF